MVWVKFFLVAFSSLFTIINPFSTASIFLTITHRDSKAKKRKMAQKAALTSIIVLVVFALAGKYILDFFSITLDAFRIAGGLIIASIGFKMIKSKRQHLRNEKERKEAIDKEDVSIIPLAIPMMAGPGAMTTVIVLMGDSTGLKDVSAILLAIVSVCLLSYFILTKSEFLEDYLGETGRRVIDRIMGLIVLVVGVQFIINGVGPLLMAWV